MGITSISSSYLYSVFIFLLDKRVSSMMRNIKHNNKDHANLVVTFEDLSNYET